MSDTKIRVRKATAMLRQDHQNVKKLFSAYDKLEDDAAEEKAELFDEIRRELTVHAQIEEEIFYPAIQGSGEEEAEELVEEARTEHRIVKELIEELSGLGAGSTEFEARIKVLKENVLHHAQEEQEEIFPCFEALDQEIQDRVADALASRKRELTTEEGAE